MADHRWIWTAPPGVDLKHRLLQWASASGLQPGLWIVPSALSRDLWLRELARIGHQGLAETVWSWEDLWRAILAAQEDCPTCLSAAGARAVLLEAVSRSRSDPQVQALGDVVRSSGFRRRLGRRMAAWTLTERSLDEPPEALEGVLAAEWVIFGQYRAVLEELGAVDEAGLAPWASRALREFKAPEALRQAARVVVIDLTNALPSTWRVLEYLRRPRGRRQPSILLTMPSDAESARPEAFREPDRLRQRLQSWGFLEERIDPPQDWPGGLRTVSARLFRNDSPSSRKLTDTSGLRFRGAPRGEEIARVIAEQIDQRLSPMPAPDSVAPEDLLVLFRSWDEEADLVYETLRHWGLPVSAEPPRPLRSEPSVLALRLAMGLPVDDFDADPLARLLRNGQLHLRDDSGAVIPPLHLAITAAAVRDTRVFRGQQSIREALVRQQAEGSDSENSGNDYRRRPKKRRARRAALALPIFDRLVKAIPPADQTGTWTQHVETLARLVEDLGIGHPDDESLGHLFNALDDHGEVLNRLGRANLPRPWRRFFNDWESLIRDLKIPSPSGQGGTVRIASVEEATGAGAAYILLANLGEGSFPRRDAVDPDRASGVEGEIGDEVPAPPREQGQNLEIQSSFPFAQDSETTPTEYGREMLRFLKILGAARRELILIYPTADEKGQDLLPAGFLEDLRWLFEPEALRACSQETRRLDPSLLELDRSFVSPAEARVQAVARAALQDDESQLRNLAASPSHRSPLLGAADALEVSAQRSRAHPDFGRYEGRLDDSKAIARIASEFGPDYRFSPSQLESLAFCPFQFFQRYVLRLDPIEERDELGEDFATRGSMIHRVLEDLHLLLETTPEEQGRSLSERIKDEIELQIRAELERLREPVSEVESGLRRIEEERMVRTGRRYADQFAFYATADGQGAECHKFEARFGTSDDPVDIPPLVLGAAAEADSVRLQGVIDRIDLQKHAEHNLFRVIDYKTGGAPSAREVQAGQALQLPLYALAAQRLLLADLGASPIDAGYWALKKKGYQAVVRMAKRDKAETLTFLETWEPFAERLEAFVLALVGRLRAGALPVDPAKKAGCENYCEYRTVCRIRQVRTVGKVRGDQLRLEATDES